ncbi:MAG TPA: zf-HC2 domain-containing protein [Pyrinomonadaceae bacterium]|nr:zf-HC2 domain-containing protein [Pyrinomonadaceae bacterium]
MKCKDLQYILPLYSDSELSGQSDALVAEHIDRCPVCRQKLSDLHEIRNGLRAVSKPTLPPMLSNSLRAAVALKLESASGRQMFQGAANRGRWVDVWLMPVSVGSLATLLLGFSFLWLIVSAELRPGPSRASEGYSPSDRTILYPYSITFNEIESDLNPMEYASSRLTWSRESPSINPRGSLVALTRDFVARPGEDELTVVADVYGNGSASITEVVEPSSDTAAVRHLQQALGNEGAAPAFVPASFDQRTDPLRVVLKIQNVSVNTNLR